MVIFPVLRQGVGEVGGVKSLRWGVASQEHTSCRSRMHQVVSGEPPTEQVC